MVENDDDFIWFWQNSFRCELGRECWKRMSGSLCNFVITDWCLNFNLWDTRLQTALPRDKPRSEGEWTRTLCQEQSSSDLIQVARSTAGQRNLWKGLEKEFGYSAVNPSKTSSCNPEDGRPRHVLAIWKTDSYGVDQTFQESPLPCKYGALWKSLSNLLIFICLHCASAQQAGRHGWEPLTQFQRPQFRKEGFPCMPDF